MENITLSEIRNTNPSGPIAELKKLFRNRIIGLVFPILLLSFVFSYNHDSFINFAWGSMLVLWIAALIYFFYSYRLINSVDTNQPVEKSRLQLVSTKLEQGLKWRSRSEWFFGILIILFTEALMNYQPGSNMASWHHQPIALRISIYLVFLVAFYFLTTTFLRFKYGKHIAELRQLVDQMQ